MKFCENQNGQEDLRHSKELEQALLQLGGHV